MTERNPPQSALLVPIHGQDLGLDPGELAAFRARHPGMSMRAVCLAGANPPEGVFDRVIRLPLDISRRTYAEAVGQQLALNEGCRMVGLARRLSAADLADASRHFGPMTAGEADVVIVPEEDRASDRLFVSDRAAFLASSWAALSGALLAERTAIAAGVLGFIGRRGVIIQGGRHAGLPRVDLGQFAAKAQLIREKLGIVIGKLPPASMRAVKRVAVVTPYYRESDGDLRRAMDSVKGQSMPVTHIMISDGFPNPLAQGQGIIHVELGAGHADGGNTPRYVGALLALAMGHDAVAFLDADNWYEPRHIQRLVERQHATQATAVFSRRNIYLPDGFKLPGDEDEDRQRGHADTSCMMLTSACEYAMHLWGQMPQEWGAIGDRVIYAELLSQRLAWTENRTMNYTSNYAVHFRQAKRPVPDKLHIIPAGLLDDFAKLGPAFRERAVSRSGRVTRVIGA